MNGLSKWWYILILAEPYSKLNHYDRSVYLMLLRYAELCCEKEKKEKTL